MERHSIAIYYTSLENVGGIERVVVELSRIFSNYECEVLLLTTEPIKFLASQISCKTDILPADESRGTVLSNFISKYKINWLILHDPSNQYIEKDIQVAHELDCKIALNIHFSFPSPIIFNEASSLYDVVLSVGKRVDAIACVSLLDAQCWNSLGLRSYHVQNPFVHAICDNKPSGSQNIIWIGRGTFQKMPEAALKVMKNVVSSLPDAKLFMVGVGPMRHSLSKLALKLGIKDNIILVDKTSDIDRYYSKASVHLLTSITESFCLVIAEAKQRGIPTVMFRIPFLDLIQSGNGVYMHEHGDNSGMAQSLISLLSDGELYSLKSSEAKCSLNDFNDAEVYTSWRKLFNSESNNWECNIGVSEMVRAWQIFNQQNAWKLDFCNAVNKFCFNKFDGIARFFTTKIYNNLVALKRRIK